MFFVNNSCKAQFYNNSQVTFYVRKECVDIIFKIKKGLYLPVSVCSLAEGRLLLACEWSDFWNRMKNMSNTQDVLAKLAKSCPLATEIFSKTTKPHFSYLDSDRKIGEIVVEMKAPVISYNISDFLHEDVVKKAKELMSFNLNLYVELEEKCPFPQWIKDLNRIRKKRM